MDQQVRRRILIIAAVVLVLGLTAVSAFLIYLSPRLRQEIELALSEKTGHEVRLEKLTWTLWPRVAFQGSGLTVANAEGPPLAEVGEFDIQGGLGDLLSSPRRLDSVVVRNLVLRISTQVPSAKPGPKESAPSESGGAPSVVIGRVAIENLRLEVGSPGNAQPPQVFGFESVVLDSIDLSQSVPFAARLRYPKPAGDLEVKGSFGPWNGADPTRTPFQGTFRFEDADLSVFQTIQGLLDVEGSFDGTMHETKVNGNADISDFAITGRGRPVPLKSKFRIAVRDSAQEIVLEDVTADFLKSEFHCQGEITDLGGQGGPTAKLQVKGLEVQVEDLILLVSQAEKPPLTGRAQVDSIINVDPRDSNGGRDRPLARGHFSIPEGQFTGVGIQETLAKISRIGGGETTGESGSSVVSNMEGDFVFDQARLDFSRLVFGVPGAKLDLQGSYDLASEGLDFHGKALLDLAPSALAPEKVSNWIKLVDPLLAGKKAGTSLPVRISGTRSSPRFWLDIGRLGR